MIPPELQHFPVSLCGDNLFVFCAVCQKRIVFAFGCIAHFVTRKNLFEGLHQLGWQIAPHVLCPDCRPQPGQDVEKTLEEYYNVATDSVTEFDDFEGVVKATERQFGVVLTHRILDRLSADES